MIDHVTLKRFAELSGYTEKAAYSKIYEGVWLEGRVWRKAPDGRVLISLSGYDAWAEGQGCDGLDPKRFRSTSDGKASGVVSDFASERQRRTSDGPGT